jgi:DnaJ-domain-containing protein 1
MLAFIIALLIVVIIGSIVYGIYKLIVGISKFGFVQSLSTKKNRCDPPHQQRGKSRRFYENTYDDEDFEDIFAEKMFENTLDDDIFENYDGPSQIDKDKLVRARLERFHISEDEAELIFGKEWRDKLGQEHSMLFYDVVKLKNKLMETGLFDQIFTNNPESLFREKVSHIIDKVIQMIESVYNEDPEYAKYNEKLCEEELGKAGTDYLKEAWEFFKKHKRSPWDFYNFINTLDASEAYKILGLAVTATIEEVKKKYRELVLKHHPDRNRTNKIQAEKELVKINQAYETIMAAA